MVIISIWYAKVLIPHIDTTMVLTKLIDIIAHADC
jgi:hypothetical protein